MKEGGIEILFESNKNPEKNMHHAGQRTGHVLGEHVNLFESNKILILIELRASSFRANE